MDWEGRTDPPAWEQGRRERSLTLPPRCPFLPRSVSEGNMADGARAPDSVPDPIQAIRDDMQRRQVEAANLADQGTRWQ